MPTKFDKEIEELLQSLGVSPPPKGKRRPRAQRLTPALARFKPSSPGQLMLISLGLFLLAFLASHLLPWAALPLAVVGGLLFLLAFASSLVAPPITKYWRDRPVDLSLSWWQRLYGWLYKKH